jgi:hypothetical protein
MSTGTCHTCLDLPEEPLADAERKQSRWIAAYSVLTAFFLLIVADWFASILDTPKALSNIRMIHRRSKC